MAKYIIQFVPPTHVDRLRMQLAALRYALGKVSRLRSDSPELAKWGRALMNIAQKFQRETEQSREEVATNG